MALGFDVPAEEGIDLVHVENLRAGR